MGRPGQSRFLKKLQQSPSKEGDCCFFWGGVLLSDVRLANRCANVDGVSHHFLYLGSFKVPCVSRSQLSYATNGVGLIKANRQRRVTDYSLILVLRIHRNNGLFHLAHKIVHPVIRQTSITRGRTQRVGVQAKDVFDSAEGFINLLLEKYIIDSNADRNQLLRYYTETAIFEI